MGRDVYDSSAPGRAVFETVDSVLGYSLTDICFNGPDEKLRLTEYAQPAIFAASLAYLAAAVDNGSVTERPAYMAGHSLGEYSALVAAGAMSLEEGLLLLQERVRLMAIACAEVPGTMAAIMGLDEDKVRSICSETDTSICNFNQATQLVIGGRLEAVAKAMTLAKEQGGKAIELNVAGAFHSPLMRSALEDLGAAVKKTHITAPEVPVVANVTAEALSSAQAVGDELTAQVASPVRWFESMNLMADAGITTYIEFGPGRVLTGMAKRIVTGATLVNVNSLEAIGAAR